jgi:hypothetical protein
MVLLPCHECHKEISSQALSCPHCGHPATPQVTPSVEIKSHQEEGAPKKKISGLWLAAAGVVALIFMMGLAITSSILEKKQKDPSKGEISRVPYAELEKEVIPNLYVSGLLKKLEPNVRRAYVNPILWNALNVDQKRFFSGCMADYVHKQTQWSASIEVYDYQSGKKLAENDNVYGFKVE